MRIIDADVMLSDLKSITVDTEHTSVLTSDMPAIIRRWIERQPTIVPKINLSTFWFDVIDPKTRRVSGCM